MPRKLNVEIVALGFRSSRCNVKSVQCKRHYSCSLVSSWVQDKKCCCIQRQYDRRKQNYFQRMRLRDSGKYVNRRETFLSIPLKINCQ